MLEGIDHDRKGDLQGLNEVSVYSNQIPARLRHWFAPNVLLHASQWALKLKEEGTITSFEELCKAHIEESGDKIVSTFSQFCEDMSSPSG